MEKLTSIDKKKNILQVNAMAARKFFGDLPKHRQVFNQVPALENYNVFTADKALTEVVGQYHADWAGPHLVKTGSDCGSRENLGAS